MRPFVILSGCSGGGKSSLLEELARRGYRVVEEPGRRIVREEPEQGGSALPWIDVAAFLRRAITVSLADLDVAPSQGWVFFDRGLIDAASALQHVTGESVLEELGRKHRYYPQVFLTPPWPEIYGTDAERRHSFDEAMAEYDRLLKTYPILGYEVILLPKIGIRERADFILETLQGS
ncbi:AAA family ATPase [Terriglobus albidus]|uniref:AAA family ATPase n=1 Tax=Terriglobus albidus TaxID=1592106 RepID=A0A5B9E536_9BACT|nr:AAA family ATPase [Terriglobus albidus]QEE27403.1 AAA family ATPase [Terriglobus albidus]